MIGSRYSFKFLSKAKVAKAYPDLSLKTKELPSTSSAEIDNKKRSFLKLAGVVGAGALITTLLPKKASAIVFGSQPGGSGSSTVGVKDASNNRINPATQETLAGIRSKTDLLTFDSGSSPGNLNVNVAAGSVGLKNTGGSQINPATEDTLAAIRAKTDLLQFSGSPSQLLTSVGGTGNIVGIKDTTGTQINPATDESLVYLRRMVKLMESQATVDNSNRQRVIIDGFGASIYGLGAPYAGAGGIGVPRVTLSNDSVISATITTIAGWGDQMFSDPARTAYAVGIRNYLNW